MKFTFKLILFFATFLLCAESAQSINVYMALRVPSVFRRNIEILALEVSMPDSPFYGKYWSVQDIQEVMMLEPFFNQSYNQVREWMQEQNVDPHLSRYYGDCVVLDLSVLQMMKLFNYNKTSETYKIPEDLRSAVSFVDGLVQVIPESNQVIPESNQVIPESNQVIPESNQVIPEERFSKKHIPFKHKISKNSSNIVAREVFTRVYNYKKELPDSVWSFISKKNETTKGLGSIEFSGHCGFNQKCLIKDQIANGVDPNPITPDHIFGNDESNIPDGESQLDVSVNWWAHPDAELWYMDAGNWLYSWAVSFVNRETVPYTISLSYGWNAADQCDITLCTDESSKEYVKRVDYEFAKMALRGVTVVVASGDAGSPGRTNEVCGGEGAETMFPIYPGSSPWVTSVGATYLIDDVSKNDPVEWTTPICQEFGCATSNREAVTTFSKTHWTSGAGFSNYAKTPVWQQDYVTAYLSSNNSMPSFRFFNQQGRAYPDVVALGHSCAVFDFWINGWMSFDGTSCSAPIFAGILSHLSNFQTRRGQPRLGFANPLLYEMKRNMPETFNLITEGNSACTEYTCCSKEFGFAATNMHWDPVKGLGSPNIGKMMEYLEKKQTKFISNASSKYFARAEVD